MELKGKVALITGGSQGIGEAIARRYAREGATVAIVARGLDRTESLVSQIRQDGGAAHAFSADCSNVEEINHVVNRVVETCEGMDILVNNAGTFITKPVMETTEADWDSQLNLNLKGTFFMVKAVIPHMAARGGGKVILISSIAGVRGFPNCPAYCASKGGAVNLTKALAVELAAKNINVNSIAPGNVETPINAHLRGPENAGYVELMSNRTPTGRAFLKPTDISGVATFLASEDSSAMHGAVMLVDDGWCAW